jgi:hypothetical protein
MQTGRQRIDGQVVDQLIQVHLDISDCHTLKRRKRTVSGNRAYGPLVLDFTKQEIRFD